MEYFSLLPLGEVLRRNHAEMLARDQRLKKVFPKAPRPVYARYPNLKEFLTRGKLPPARNATRHQTEAGRSGVTRCNKGLGRPGCSLCPYITETPNQVIREVKKPSSGLTGKVQGSMTCRKGGRGGFIYMLSCTKSGTVYLGESGRPQPLQRFGEHRRSVESQDSSKAVGAHFEQHRADREHLTFTPFIAVKSRDPFARKFLEIKLIIKHKLIESDLGININV